MYAPGLFDPDRSPERDPAHTRQLLGFQLDSKIGEPASPAMKLTAEGAAWLSSFSPDRVFGSFERPRWDDDLARKTLPGGIRLRERFFAQDTANAQDTWILARFLDGGRPSLVMRRTPESTDLWIGSVMAPADLLRAVARRAGCHLFCDADEIIYANRSFLAIHTAAAGTREFHLRRPADVIEVFSGDVLARDASRFSDPIPPYRTRLYFLGPAAQWQTQSARADAFLKEFREALQTLRKKTQRPTPAVSAGRR
jgi:hypothetical protein